MWRCIATQLDTVAVATAWAPFPAGDAFEHAVASGSVRPAGRGWRWSAAAGLDVECGTASTYDVHDASGRPLPYRWTLGPAALWGDTLRHLTEAWPALGGGRLMAVHVCRDWADKHDRIYLPDPGGWGARCRRGRRPAAAASAALLGGCRLAWSGGRAQEAGIFRGDDGFSAWRGTREKSVQLLLYHKTAAHETCEGHVPLYADVWAAGGWSTRLACYVCGEPSTRLGPCPCGDGDAVYAPVLRAELRWPSRQLTSRRWEDLAHACEWPREHRPLQAHLPQPLKWDSGSAVFTPPRQKRAARTLASVAKHHADLAACHQRRADAINVAPASTPVDDVAGTGDSLAAALALLRSAADADDSLHDAAGAPVKCPGDLPFVARGRSVEAVYRRGYRDCVRKLLAAARRR